MNVVQSTTVNASEGRDRKVVNAITIVTIQAVMYSHADSVRKAMHKKAIIISEGLGFSVTIEAQATVDSSGTIIMAIHEVRQRTSSA